MDFFHNFRTVTNFSQHKPDYSNLPDTWTVLFTLPINKMAVKKYSFSLLQLFKSLTVLKTDCFNQAIPQQ